MLVNISEKEKSEKSEGTYLLSIPGEEGLPTSGSRKHRTSASCSGETPTG
jgi:hypothetical protein